MAAALAPEPQHVPPAAPEPTFTTEPATAVGHGALETPTGKKSRRGRKTKPDAAPLTVEGSLAKQNTIRRIILIAAAVVAVALTGNAIWGIISPPPSADSISEQVLDQVTSDGTYAPLVSVSERFLATYYSPATDKDALDRRAVNLNRLTQGRGEGWVSNKAGETGSRISGITLDRQPQPSTLFPGLYTLSFTATLTTKNVPTTVGIQVVAGMDDAFVPYVALPPSVFPARQPGDADPLEFDSDSALSESALPRFSEFLRDWGNLPVNPNEDQVSAFDANYLAPQVRGDYMYHGLGGAFTLGKVTLSLADISDAGDRTYGVGYATVTWTEKATGVIYTNAYQVWMRYDEDRWVMEGLLPL